MQYCNQCNKGYADNMKFCPECGTKLVTYQTPQQSYQQPSQQQYLHTNQQQKRRTISFSDAYENFSGGSYDGRATRAEYWYFQLTLYIVFFVAIIVGSIFFGENGIGLVILVGIGTFPFSVALIVRRLHDLGLSGWWFWAGFLPILGQIGALYIAFAPSEERDNVYGPYA